MAPAKTNTKEKLIETARELIWRSSYNAVSVDDICKKADVKKGSFYHFFPSKAHLAMETIDVGMVEIKALYEDIFAPARPPLERFSLMVSHLVDMQKQVAKEYGHVCGCPMATLGSELAAQDREIEKKMEAIYQFKSGYYVRTLQDMKAEGLIPDHIDTKIKAEEIFSFIVGQMIVARIKNDLSFLENNMEHALLDLIGVKMEQRLKIAG